MPLGHALGRVDDPHQTPGKFGYRIGLVGRGKVPVGLNVGEEQPRILVHVEWRQLGRGGRRRSRRRTLLAPASQCKDNQHEDQVGARARAVEPRD